MASPDMKDYVEVPERILSFYQKFPEGSLQSEYELTTFPNKAGKDTPHFIVKAWAYRTPNDPKPGVGLASEPIPGFTPYTKGSELMNAETSAWGRALAALGFIGNGKIASANEVRNRQETAEPAPTTIPAAPATLTEEEAARALGKLKELGVKPADLDVRVQSYGVEDINDLTLAQAQDLVKFFIKKATVAA